MSVLLVDWLGRGGIAQTSEAWAIELEGAGIDTVVVTRGERELGSGVVPVRAAPTRRGRLTAHHAVAREAARQIRELRPDVVVVQNYVAPVLERPVFDAARSVKARVVLVVHDHRLHTAQAGTRLGLRRELQRADVVVAHTHYVAGGIESYSGRAEVSVVPHPVQVGMLRHDPLPFELPDDGRLRAATFGVLKRAYKGSSMVEDIARLGIDHWAFVAIGTGASTNHDRVAAIPGYASPGRLTAVVARTDATLAPYTHATQSGVVVLAHVLGSVPIASAVGGIPEQIDDGIDGVLLPRAASPALWRDALVSLTDDAVRKEMALAGEARAWRDHEAFSASVTAMVS